MNILLQVEWTEPGPVLTGAATVTFEEVKLPEGYHVRKITNIAWPVGFPEERKDALLKPIYHKLNFVRQKVVIDDAVVK